MKRHRFNNFIMPGKAFFFVLLTVLSIGIIKSKAQTSENSSLEYIYSFQDNLSGGVKEEFQDEPQSLQSDWVSLAFSSSSYNPATIGKNNDLLTFLKTDACELSSLTDIERRIISLEAANIDSHNINGCDMPKKVSSKNEPSGKIGSDVVSTVFGVIALRAAGVETPQESVDYIINNQKEDGGWDSGYGTESNFTAQAIMSLVSSDKIVNKSVYDKAKIYLKNLQTNTGGIKYDSNLWSVESDAFSDAYTLQAINSLGEHPSDDFWKTDNRTILDDLKILKNENGSYKFNLSYLNMNPVWTTSIVTIAMNGDYLPINKRNLKPWQQAVRSATATPSPLITATPEISEVTLSTDKTTTNNKFQKSSNPNISALEASTRSAEITPSVTTKLIKTKEIIPNPNAEKVLGDSSERKNTIIKWIVTFILFSLATYFALRTINRKNDQKNN